jgi:hypothetical protein
MDKKNKMPPFKEALCRYYKNCKCCITYQEQVAGQYQVFLARE